MSTYSRFEVRYRVGESQGLTYVWGWADDRKELQQLHKGLAANAQLQHVATIDHRREVPAAHEFGAPHMAGTQRPFLLL